MIESKTETDDMSAWQQSGGIISQSNTTVIAVEPPAASNEIELGSVPENDMLGPFELVWRSDGPFMDQITHQALLNESLQNYEEIWRTLAEK